MKELKALVRPNVWRMAPYSCARDEFEGEASVYLDANENPWNAPYNRYPDPMQKQVKERLSVLKGVNQASIFLGNGSDEAIDLVIRAFCEPGLENMITIAPSYGMYQVCAEVNNVECQQVPLKEGFQLDADAVLAAVNERTKVIFLCSPNNPSGNNLDRASIYRILKEFDGIVVIDEAYIDFSSHPSFVKELADFPNMIVLQTLSKAWGAAGIRLGMAFASPEIIGVMNKIKYPYNVNMLTQAKALEFLNKDDVKEAQVQEILSERARLEKLFTEAPLSFHVYPSDANFLLVNVDDADALYKELVKQGIVVRNRNNVMKCQGCLRITIGTPEENNILLAALKAWRSEA